MTAELKALLRPLVGRARFVVGQLGQSLDGRIATASGRSHYINGPEDIRRLHHLRALVDAVVVGAGTVTADDPRLTVRHAEGTNPVRVVLDPRGRVDPERSVFTDGAAPTLWLRAAQPEDDAHATGGTGADRDAPGATSAVGSGSGEDASRYPVEIVRLAAGPEGFEPRAILEVLASRGLHRVLVEGGGTTVSRFLQAGALDRLHISVAPLLIGSGLPGIMLPRIESLDEAIRPEVRHVLLGRDVVFDLDLGGGGGSPP